ncbi:peptidoglycan recognition protein 1-like [Contarinia nasturtii]|uniref:peptidoglycan recognition protein 1-like n=1 Tax=Contarinia nasturtii TaxID=265458 RepID=UPI0012D4197C|nr:peptidoglycan recognition protein 1-like [Contarinia nasturtii]
MDLNLATQSANMIDDTSSTDESESLVIGNETIEIEPQIPNIGYVQVNNSSDVTFGNRINYHGPVTIHVTNQNQSQVTNNIARQHVEILNRPVFTTETAGPLRIVKRNEWFALPPQRELERLELPAIRVIIAYTMGKCATTHRECSEIVRSFQADHIEMKGWDDIGYNFLIGGDGSVYVGRGWDYTGAHSRIYNKRSICIAFIGTFRENAPPERSLIAAQQLIEVGVKLGKIDKSYYLYGHRQLIQTTSPGNKIYEIIQTWNNWSETVIPP